MPFVISFHIGRGANPPALPHIRANPLGISDGDWGVYILLTSLVDADDNSIDGKFIFDSCLTIGTSMTVFLVGGIVVGAGVDNIEAGSGVAIMFRCRP